MNTRTAVAIGSAVVTMAVRAVTLLAQGSTDIRLNQVGFYPGAPKIAVVLRSDATTFHVTSPDQRDTVFGGPLTTPGLPDYAKHPTRIADFSALKRNGTYVLVVPGTGRSHPFEVRPAVHTALTRGALKGFYYQRASMALLPAFAGIWSRDAGHPDTAVLVHASAASGRRAEGSIIASPRGWYDAGDYNKYVVNSGITVATLLSLYEDFPAYASSLNADIPESTNALPDLLDEVLWNLRWMLSMQDPFDGGVYHKLTNPEFDALSTRPADARNVRYVVQKSTPATLDFAAVTAQAARVFRKFGAELPGFADTCLSAAMRAWEWADRHPAIAYDQNQLNSRFAPAIKTGEYGDKDFSDEKAWAAAELLITTGNLRFYHAFDKPLGEAPIPSWGQVRTLGYYTILRHASRLPAEARALAPDVQLSVLAAAGNLTANIAQQPYGVVFAKRANDLVWGSTAVAANQGIALIQAYKLTHNRSYLTAALANLDYLLGRNATGYSFVTGYGTQTPMHPHHRPSVSDTVTAPVPGLLVGGPNAISPQQDHCTSYKSSVPDEVYTDDECSYASNEIAINWNAPLVYLAAAIEALQFDAGFSPVVRTTQNPLFDDSAMTPSVPSFRSNSERGGRDGLSEKASRPAQDR